MSESRGRIILDKGTLLVGTRAVELNHIAALMLFGMSAAMAR